MSRIVRQWIHNCERAKDRHVISDPSHQWPPCHPIHPPLTCTLSLLSPRHLSVTPPPVTPVISDPPLTPVTPLSPVPSACCRPVICQWPPPLSPQSSVTPLSPHSPPSHLYPLLAVAPVTTSPVTTQHHLSVTPPPWSPQSPPSHPSHPPLTCTLSLLSPRSRLRRWLLSIICQWSPPLITPVTPLSPQSPPSHLYPQLAVAPVTTAPVTTQHHLFVTQPELRLDRHFDAVVAVRHVLLLRGHHLQRTAGRTSSRKRTLRGSGQRCVL